MYVHPILLYNREIKIPSPDPATKHSKAACMFHCSNRKAYRPKFLSYAKPNAITPAVIFSKTNDKKKEMMLMGGIHVVEIGAAASCSRGKTWASASWNTPTL